MLKAVSQHRHRSLGLECASTTRSKKVTKKNNNSDWFLIHSTCAFCRFFKILNNLCKFSAFLFFALFQVPIITPFIVFLAAIFIVVVPIVVDPQIEFVFAAIFIAIGYVVYVPLVHFKLQFGFMGKIC
jgi:hypothetical protein